MTQTIPPSRSTTMVLEVGEQIESLSDAEKLGLIRSTIEEMLQNRMKVLRAEATIISSDMEALALRLEQRGHNARIEDVKSARWYRTAGDLRLLQSMYKFVCAITGTAAYAVRLPPEDDMDTPVPSNIEPETSGDD